jgi:hypothetical protein
MNEQTKAPWWRWPENRYSGTVAWFVILRRLAFYPLTLLGALLYVTGILMGYGLREGAQAWRDVR